MLWWGYLCTSSRRTHAVAGFIQTGNFFCEKFRLLPRRKPAAVGSCFPTCECLSFPNFVGWGFEPRLRLTALWSWVDVLTAVPWMGWDGGEEGGFVCWLLCPEWDGMVGKRGGSFADCCALNEMGWWGRVGVHLLTAVPWMGWDGGEEGGFICWLLCPEWDGMVGKSGGFICWLLCPEWDGMVGKSGGSFADCCALNGMGWWGRGGVHLLTAVPWMGWDGGEEGGFICWLLCPEWDGMVGKSGGFICWLLCPEWDGMVGKSGGSFADCCALNGMGWWGRVGVRLLTAVFFSPDHSIELRGEPADRAEDAQRWPHRGQTLTLQATGTGALFGQWLLMYSLGNRYWCTLQAVGTDVLFRQQVLVHLLGSGYWCTL